MENEASFPVPMALVLGSSGRLLSAPVDVELEFPSSVSIYTFTEKNMG